jgi:hypothetical protein
MCSKASATTDAVLDNELETIPARHRKAREASFALVEQATKALDSSTKAAENEIKLLQDKTRGPPPTKDVMTEARQRELRERLASLPKDRQRAILDEAIGHGDDHLIGAVLAVSPWLVGMTQIEQDMLRSSWARKRYPADLDRIDRITKAIGDARRAGVQSIHFVDTLTSAEIVAEAEKSEKRSVEALRAVKS